MKLETAIQELFERKGFDDLNSLVSEMADLAVHMGMGAVAFVEELDALKDYLQEKEEALSDDIFAQIRSAFLGLKS